MYSWALLIFAELRFRAQPAASGAAAGGPGLPLGSISRAIAPTPLLLLERMALAKHTAAANLKSLCTVTCQKI